MSLPGAVVPRRQAPRLRAALGGRSVTVDLSMLPGCAAWVWGGQLKNGKFGFGLKIKILIWQLFAE